MTLKNDIKAKLQRQWPEIAASRLKAITRIISESYVKATGLAENDPPELWQFALGKSEPRMDPVTEAGLNRQKEIGDRIRQYAPAYDADKTYEADQKVLRAFGAPTFRQTVQRLSARIEDETELARCLSTLFKLNRQSPFTRAKYDEAARTFDKLTRFLLLNWIQDPQRDDWVRASLCFYSDRAMTNLVYYHEHKKALPAQLLTKEPERIRKLYKALGLIAARPRLIGKFQFEAGKLRWTFRNAVLAD